MIKDSLLFGVATYNADPFNIYDEEILDEVWETIQEEGYHEINQNTDDYEIGCAKLDLSPKAGVKIYETNNFTMIFARFLTWT